jgi:hypothetical protein
MSDLVGGTARSARKANRYRRQRSCKKFARSAEGAPRSPTPRYAPTATNLAAGEAGHFGWTLRHAQRIGEECQKQPWFDIHDKVNEIAANGFCGFPDGPGFSVTHGQIER